MPEQEEKLINPSPEASKSSVELRKSVHPTDNIVHPLPSGAVLSEVLKTIELQLQRRGLLPATSLDTFNPIWFLAETERNIFLWRRGLSLDRQDEFEFWIDIPGLLEKRLRQLSEGSGNNPFINPLWGLANADAGSMQRESDYISTFIEIVEKVKEHAQALSQVGVLLERELYGERGRTRVVLPE